MLQSSFATLQNQCTANSRHPKTLLRRQVLTFNSPSKRTVIQCRFLITWFSICKGSVTKNGGKLILIIDYGMGNLRSVSKALEHFGAKVAISDKPQDLASAEKIILPGVGAFGDAMEELNQRGLAAALLREVRSKKKLLGICLGLQLLFETSEESPGVPGLGILPGSVVRFRSPGIKVPHIGWNSITLQNPHPLLEKVQDESYFYFVHSFYGKPAQSRLSAASCTYGTETFAAMVGEGHIFATQFHPEKSQDAGLQILKNFAAW